MCSVFGNMHIRQIKNNFKHEHSSPIQLVIYWSLWKQSWQLLNTEFTYSLVKVQRTLNLTTVYWVKTIRSCLADKHACVLTSGFWHSWVTATSSQPADDVALQCGQWGKPRSHGSAETTPDTPSVTLHSPPAQTRFGLLSNRRYHIIFFVANDLW